MNKEANILLRGFYPVDDSRLQNAQKKKQFQQVYYYK